MNARALLVAAALATPLLLPSSRAVGNPAGEVTPIESLWTPPADIGAADVFNGPWGAASAPDPDAVYTFVRPKKGGTNPGVVVRDPVGRTWRVKQSRGSRGGPEGPAEVTVSRVLSALGYHQPPVYFLPAFRMTDASGTRIEPGGRFRLDEPSMRELDSWRWQRNPFVGTRPLQGLLVILHVFNNSDLKDSNNSVYEVRTADRIEHWYVVRDLGASLGDTGLFGVDRNDIDEFERHPFTLGEEKGRVRFAFRGTQSTLYRDRITVDDLQWATTLLGELSDAQWHDAFRAGGYEPEISERFIAKIKSKIDEAQRLSATWRTARTER
jgi:hypothetical protein